MHSPSHHHKAICESLGNTNNWEVNLVGSDGSVSVDVMPLVLFSPFLQGLLKEQQDKPYLTVIILPDVPIEHLKLLCQLLKHGNVLVSDDTVCDIGQLASTLGVDLSGMMSSACDTQEYQTEFLTRRSSTFECNQCGKSFGNFELLACHEEYAHPGYSFSPLSPEFNDISLTQSTEQSIEIPAHKCDECENAFTSKESLEAHMQEHEFPYSCKICGKKFRSVGVFKMHDHASKREERMDLKVKLFHKKPKFQCKKCKWCFKRRDFFQRHQLVHMGPQSLFECQKCGKTFKWKISLISHLKAHESEEPSTFDLTSLKSELEVVHGKAEVSKLFSVQVRVPPLSAKEIATYMVSGNQFNQGMESVKDSAEDELFFNTVQQVKILTTNTHSPNTKNKNNIHVDNGYNHVKAKPFGCEQCGLWFSFKARLEKHLRCFHSSTGKYKLPKTNDPPVSKSSIICRVCLKCFNSRKQLQKHRKNFHSVIKFQCDVCRKGFDGAFALRRHVFSHGFKS